eukprot:UN33192
MGKGIHSSVYVGTYLYTKAVIKTLDTTINIDNYFREIEITDKYYLYHPNICRFFGMVVNQGEIWIIMQYYKLRDIGTYIKNNKEIISLKQKCNWICQIGSTLEYLRSKSKSIQGRIFKTNHFF